MEPAGRPWMAQRSLERFLLVGSAAAMCYCAACWALVAFGLRKDLAGSLAYLASMPLSFLMHRRFSFSSRNPAAHDGVRFIAMSAASTWLAGSGLVIAETTLGLSLTASITLMCMVIPLFNYASMRLWVFALKPVNSQRGQ